MVDMFFEGKIRSHEDTKVAHRFRGGRDRYASTAVLKLGIVHASVEDTTFVNR